MARFVVPALLGALASLGAAHCPNSCNGHGRCVEVNRCECFASWTGGDCSLRKCPTGSAWADVAIGVDTAHQPSECSSRGICDGATGECDCFPGYEGAACERTICPADCELHGECNSMRHNAQQLDRGVVRVPNPYTNVRPPYRYDVNWDADMIQGCSCDSGYQGWNCGERACIRGDDPMTTGQADEVQLLRCDLDPADPLYQGVQFTLSFRGAVTKPFSAAATAGDIRAALEALPTIQHVRVEFSDGGVSFCDATYYTNNLGSPSNPLTQPASGNVVLVTFQTEHGDVPRLVVLDQNAKPLYGPKDNAISTAAKGETLVATTSLSPVTTRTWASVVGTKEDLPCSGRGRCNTGSGVCGCYPGYTSSDGAGRKGTLGDCGFPYLPITSCPGAGGIECSGHGSCSGHPSYLCTCDEGWAGGDCSERSCPAGPAWFDYPTADNKAHAMAECSNKGRCNRLTGECACESAFEGAACERMTCPGKNTPTGVCSGNGQCLTMFELAQYSRVNGDPAPTTYGQDPNNDATWDAHMSRGCLCDEGWMGPDCSQRTCPVGNDITLFEADESRLDEVQALSCSLLSLAPTAPTFQLSFRGEATAALAPSASAAEVQAALEALTTVGAGGIEVSYAKNPTTTPPAPDNFCLALPGQTATFRFKTRHGDVPPIRVVMDENTRDALTGSYGFGQGFLGTQLEFVGGDPATDFTTSLRYQKTPTYPATGIRSQEVRKGSSGNAECSGRGICDRKTGQCQCFIGFGSSNDNRGPGAVENCGWREPIQVAPKGLRG